MFQTILFFCLVFKVACDGVFSEDQLQYLPPGVRYLTTSSPPNQPSVRLNEEEENSAAKLRTIYGGKGDKLHLGGFTAFDAAGISNNTFNYMIGGLGVKSLLDVGCGKGVSTKYFHDKRVKVQCVEGSHDAVTQSLLPADRVVEHDFTRGPWWPKDTYDACWSVEFVEHVGRANIENYLPSFHKCAIVFVSHSIFGGWHHVEVHPRYWWKSRLVAQGFSYSQDLTQMVSEMARAGKNSDQQPKSAAEHIIHTMMVFINPLVASKPQHKHLFSGQGCFSGKNENKYGGLPCEGVDQLAPEFEPLLSCKIDESKLMDKASLLEQKRNRPFILFGGVWSCKENPRAVPVV